MCNGTVQVQMANGSSANVDAVFEITAGGSSESVRVRAGATKTVTIAAAGAANVWVFDNRGQTKTGRWTQPGGC
jgi:hypothetical protein